MILANKHIAPRQQRVKFIEDKYPSMDVVTKLLDECAAVNQWANFGPLYDRLASEYSEYFNLGPGLSLTPCANGAIALELLARHLAEQAGKPKLRWIGSAFSFKNLGRGYFAEMDFLDCDEQGVLDLDALKALPLDSYDGFIVTNPFGLHRNFDPFIRFALANDKKMLIDNAAGIDQYIPPWPWQIFSLHHTKPFGFGEGGLALSPTKSAEELKLLMNYDHLRCDPGYWLSNGKISDVSCAFLIARLRTVETWKPRYEEQRERVEAIALQAGLRPLLSGRTAAPSNSLPLLMGAMVDDEKLATAPRHVDVTRQYEPLADRPKTVSIYGQMINFPVHPDISQLNDAELLDEIALLSQCCS